ncbi:MAG: hypothetical protein KGL39_33810 [Patescibacteria group bacterium]|nr:hypothetical protein [Patescibacteria group bacterium]
MPAVTKRKVSPTELAAAYEEIERLKRFACRALSAGEIMLRCQDEIPWLELHDDELAMVTELAIWVKQHGPG